MIIIIISITTTSISVAISFATAISIAITRELVSGSLAADVGSRAHVSTHH